MARAWNTRPINSAAKPRVIKPASTRSDGAASAFAQPAAIKSPPRLSAVPKNDVETCQWSQNGRALMR